MAMQRAVAVAVPILDTFQTMPTHFLVCTAHKAASSLEEEALERLILSRLSQHS